MYSFVAKKCSSVHIFGRCPFSKVFSLIIRFTFIYLVTPEFCSRYEVQEVAQILAVVNIQWGLKNRFI